MRLCTIGLLYLLSYLLEVSVNERYDHVTLALMFRE